jgi:hypothetical protein
MVTEIQLGQKTNGFVDIGFREVWVSQKEKKKPSSCET